MLMRLRKPYIDWIRVTGNNGSGGRYLHAVTYFPGVLYQTDGFDLLPPAADTWGAFRIILKVKRLGDTGPGIVTAVTHIAPVPANWPEEQDIDVVLSGHETGSAIPRTTSEDDPDETVKSLTSEDDPDETVK